MVHDKGTWLEYVAGGYKYKVTILFGDVALFQNPSNRPMREFMTARRLFINLQRQFNLQGIVDPECELFDEKMGA